MPHTYRDLSRPSTNAMTSNEKGGGYGRYFLTLEPYPNSLFPDRTVYAPRFMYAGFHLKQDWSVLVRRMSGFLQIIRLPLHREEVAHSFSLLSLMICCDCARRGEQEVRFYTGKEIMHYLFILLHRWVGLVIAGFLIITGLTGAVISWDHELDDLLNSHLTHVDSRGAYLSSLDLAQAIETRDPRARVTFIPLAPEAGEALAFGVDPRVNPATGKLYGLGYNQVFIDPVTGDELGRREWGAVWPVTQENLVSFLYKLHFSLHMPEMWALTIGVSGYWEESPFSGPWTALSAST